MTYNTLFDKIHKKGVKLKTKFFKIIFTVLVLSTLFVSYVYNKNNSKLYLVILNRTNADFDLKNADQKNYHLLHFYAFCYPQD